MTPKQIEFIEQLKKMDRGDEVQIFIHLKKWSLSERTDHYGEYEGIQFEFTAYTNWKRAILECGMSLEDFIVAIEETPIEKMKAGHFYDLWCYDCSDGDLDFEDEKFTPELTEEQEEELDMNELYFESEIENSEYMFDADSIWSIEVKGVVDVKEGVIETITYETE